MADCQWWRPLLKSKPCKITLSLVMAMYFSFFTFHQNVKWSCCVCTVGDYRCSTRFNAFFLFYPFLPFFRITCTRWGCSSIWHSVYWAQLNLWMGLHKPPKLIQKAGMRLLFVVYFKLDTVIVFSVVVCCWYFLCVHHTLSFAWEAITQIVQPTRGQETAGTGFDSHMALSRLFG